MQNSKLFTLFIKMNTLRRFYIQFSGNIYLNPIFYLKFWMNKNQIEDCDELFIYKNIKMDNNI